LVGSTQSYCNNKTAYFLTHPVVLSTNRPKHADLKRLTCMGVIKIILDNF